jgi:hypothetical protein
VHEDPDGELQPDAGPAPRPFALPQPSSRPAPLRVQAMPVADLPEPYLAAVMKGLKASRSTPQEVQRK